MTGDDEVYVIDNNKSRGEKLHTIFEFIGETPVVTNYGKWQVIAEANPSVIVLGEDESTQKTLNELDALINKFAKIPVIIIGDKLNNSQLNLPNVVSCHSFPFTY